MPDHTPPFRKFAPYAAVFLVGIAAAASPGGAAATAPRRPNIVLLVADDVGYGELGCQGNPEIPTPHIDSIAAGGVRFTQGYVTASYCHPSRAGLMTGCWQTRFGCELNPVGAANEDPRVGLPRARPTLAQHLHDAGYTTGLVGKWHLGGTAPHHPLRRGFDEFFGFLHEGHFYVPPPYRGVTTMLRRRTLPDGGQGRWGAPPLIYSTHMGHNEPPYDANNPILRGGQPVVEAEYLTEAFTREAVDFIGRHADKPFFLYLAYSAVHSPLQATDAKMRQFAHIDDVHRRIFAGMLSSLDDSVGAILEKLREEDLQRDTLVFFLSDNGGQTRELTSSNHPLRGGKGDLYEGGIRVPMLMQWPGRLPAGAVEHRPVVSLDVFATALAAAGQMVPEAIDGVDLLPYLTGVSAGRPHETLFWRMGKRAALRHGDWKIVTANHAAEPAAWELYDLGGDAGEHENLAATLPERVGQLIRLWHGLDAEMAAPLWSP